ncbi:MAG: methyltransferase domain-containing protein [Candidatus Micrarchaeaceae archaeon]
MKQFMQNRFDLILELLQCPECRLGELTVEQDESILRCKHCRKQYQVKDGILDLLNEQDVPLAKTAFGKLAAKSYDVFAARSAFRKLYRWQFEDEFAEYTSSIEFMSSDILCDVGCGTGNYTLQFARQLNAGVAIGVDISWAMLELLVQHAQSKGITNVVAIRANAENLPLKDGSLCKVFNGCLHHLFPRIQSSVAETYRCLEQGGVFFGSTFFTTQSALFGMIQQFSAFALAARPVVPEVLEQELGKVGFRNVVIRPGRIGQFFFGSYDAVKQGGRPTSACT